MSSSPAPQPTLVADEDGKLPERKARPKAEEAAKPVAPKAALEAVPVAPRAAPKPPTPLELKAGQMLGDYRLEELLGQGATASVWRATDVRLRMPIALKLFMPAGQAGQVLLRGVMREARATSRVVSDHVIRVKDAGSFEDTGLGFIAMELCAAYPDPSEVPPGQSPELRVGRSLEVELPPTLEDCVRVIAQASRGVADAHREGVFHRDIKPANILCRPGTLRAQITDFGLTVAELRSDGGGSVRIPVAGAARLMIVGTPNYLAPEAAEGLPLDLDAGRDRALLTGLDVYGLGATLYTLIIGAPPYVPKENAKSVIADLIEQVRKGPPRPLFRHPESRFPVPEALVRIVEKAMARKASARYRSAADLAEDLELFLANQPTSLDGDFPGWRANLWLRRNRLQVSAAASVAILCGALAATGVVGHRLTTEVQAAEARIAELDALHVALSAEAQKWEQEAGVASAEARQQQARASAAMQQVAEKSSSLTATQRRVLALAAELDQVKAVAENQKLRAEGAESARDANLSEAQAQRSRAEQAEGQRDSARDESEAQRRRADGAEDERDAAQMRAAELLTRVKETERDRDAANAEVASLRTELSQREASLTASKAREAELNKRLSAAESSRAAAEASRNASEDEISSLRASMARQEDEIKRLRAALAALQTP